jgi:hypothetical protein
VVAVPGSVQVIAPGFALRTHPEEHISADRQRQVARFRDDGPAASNKETIMASRGKKKTTFAKLNRETKLRERRAEKEARKQARRMDAEAAAEAGETAPAEDFETVPGDEFETVSAGTVGTAPDPA